MNGKRQWLGWIALGIGGIALLVALFGSRFGPQSAGGWNAPQAYAQGGPIQSGNGPQGNAAGPGANAQPGMRQRGNGPQGGVAGPGANAQPSAGQPGNTSQGNAADPGANAQPSAGQQGNRSQGNAAGPGANARRGPGQPGNRGFGLGSWLRLPFKLIGGAFQLAMVALLVLLGFWLIRGRAAGSKTASGQAAPVQTPPQGPQSPTGESYSDE